MHQTYKIHAKLPSNFSVPTTTAHSALSDTTFHGYNIPKSADILANLYGIHMDPEIFPEPTKFNPDRFLNEKGNLVNTDLVIAFGVGKLLNRLLKQYFR